MLRENKETILEELEACKSIYGGNMLMTIRVHDDGQCNDPETVIVPEVGGFNSERPIGDNYLALGISRTNGFSTRSVDEYIKFFERIDIDDDGIVFVNGKNKVTKVPEIDI
jgi:hypothetical protein